MCDASAMPADERQQRPDMGERRGPLALRGVDREENDVSGLDVGEHTTAGDVGVRVEKSVGQCEQQGEPQGPRSLDVLWAGRQATHADNLSLRSWPCLTRAQRVQHSRGRARPGELFGTAACIVAAQPFWTTDDGRHRLRDGVADRCLRRRRCRRSGSRRARRCVRPPRACRTPELPGRPGRTFRAVRVRVRHRLSPGWWRRCHDIRCSR